MTPASRMASISSEVATGRRIKGRDGLIALAKTIVDTGLARESAAVLGTAVLSLSTWRLVRFLYPLLRTRRLRRASVGIDQLYLRAFAQLVRTVDHHQVSRLDAALHLGGLAFCGANLERRDRRGLIRLDEEDEGAWSAALDCGGWNERRVLPRFDAHAHVDELVGEENAILIGKFSLELDRARRGVDLIVDRQQAAGRELVLGAAVVCVDNEVLPCLHAFDDARNIVLGNRIDDCYRLHRGDRDQTVPVARPTNVAWLDR